MIQFVTGTDTGVGKTVAAAALALDHRRGGRRVAYLKPVQTGLGRFAPGDAAFVAAVAGVPAREGLRFTEALAPAVAAERAGRTVDLEALVRLAGDEAAGVDVLLVEGAGGLLAPLADERTMADLAALLDAEVVVVARPALGTLNHTALTVEAIRRRGLRSAGLVVSGWPAHPGVLERTNLARLARLAPLLGVVPLVAGLDTARPPTGRSGRGGVRLRPAPAWAEGRPGP